MERKSNDVQINFSRCNSAEQPHDRVVERESAKWCDLFSDGEFYAIRPGCVRGRTIKHVLLEILLSTTPDEETGMTVCTDSGAARSMIH